MPPSANKVSLGYQHEFPLVEHLSLAVGGLASAYAYPDSLKPSYGHEGEELHALWTGAVRDMMQDQTVGDRVIAVATARRSGGIVGRTQLPHSAFKPG